MKKRTLFFIMAGMFLLFIMSNPAVADTAVSVEHQLVSETGTANGMNISLYLTVRNLGTEALSNVTLELADPMLILTEPDNGSYSLGYLPIDTDVQFYWDVTSATPMIDSLHPLHIMGTGTDAAGQTVEFKVISEVVRK